MNEPKIEADKLKRQPGLAPATCSALVRFEADGDPNETVCFRCILKAGHKGNHMTKSEDCPDDPTWIPGINARKYNPPPSKTRNIWWDNTPNGKS